MVVLIWKTFLVRLQSIINTGFIDSETMLTLKQRTDFVQKDIRQQITADFGYVSYDYRKLLCGHQIIVSRYWRKIRDGSICTPLTKHQIFQYSDELLVNYGIVIANKRRSIATYLYYQKHVFNSNLNKKS